MRCNINPTERIARVIIGAAVASLAFWGPQSLWFLLALIPVVTGAIGWCPPYALMGINTAKKCSGGSCCCATKSTPKA